MKTLVALLGRVCLSLLFILAGANKFLDWQGAETHLINGLCDLLNYTQGMMQAQDLLQWALPWTPQLLVAAALIELIGGLLLFFGIQLRFAAFLLALFLIPATIVAHHFWYLEGPDQQLQMAMFLKNLSIFGGLLYVSAMGKGSSSSKKQAKESEK